MPKVGETVKTEEDISNLAKLDSLEQEIAEKDRCVSLFFLGLVGVSSLFIMWSESTKGPSLHAEYRAIYC